MTWVGGALRTSRSVVGRYPLVAAILLLIPIIAGIVGGRWTVDRFFCDSGFFSQAEGEVVGASSLQEAVENSRLVAVVRIFGEPTNRTITSKSTSVLQKNVEGEVQHYLKGSAPSLLIVAQNYEITEGSRCSKAEQYVSLTSGRTYVLFLAQGSTPERWIPFGVPLGFQVDGERLAALNGVSPEEWGLSTLADLSREVEAALPPAGE